MRIRSNRNINRETLQRAAEFAARVSGAAVEFEGGYPPYPKRAQYPYIRGFEVKLHSDGTLRRHRTNGGTQFACTWEQWGHFINYLLSVEPTTQCGRYRGRADFDEQTNHKFRAIVVRSD